MILNIEKRTMGNLFQFGESWSGLEIKTDEKKENTGIFEALREDKKIKFNRPGTIVKARESPQFKIMVIP